MIALTEIVESGLCIGCGLCKSIAPESIEIRMTDYGGERPVEIQPLADSELDLINKVCPGLKVELPDSDVPRDRMWGPVLRLVRGYSTDPDVRFRAATGGVLSGLGQYLLSSGRVERVLHMGPRKGDPLYTEAHVSNSANDVMTGSGSFYGPSATLIPLMQMIDEGRPMAVIAKPCDIAAVRNLISERPEVSEVVKYVLAMVCGGASRMTKNWDLLAEFGVKDEEVASLRHRGFGNPGPTRVATKDGRAFETTYLKQWQDEGKWDLQWRCKVCPDGMGEVTDLVALDCWPGGAPVGEDTGFNGIIARTERGAELLNAAIADGALELDMDDLPIDETLEDWQPHQSRRKAALASRIRAMVSQGLPEMATPGIRLDQAEHRLSADDKQAEFDGTVMRIKRGVHGQQRPS